MNRRGFLGSILAAAAAPAIVRADSLMRIVPRETVLLGSAVPNGHYGKSIVSELKEHQRALNNQMRQGLGFTGWAEGRAYLNGHPYEPRLWTPRGAS